jgi:hypothetical protein
MSRYDTATPGAETFGPERLLLPPVTEEAAAVNETPAPLDVLGKGETVESPPASTPTEYIIHHVTETIERGAAETVFVRLSVGTTPLRILGKDEERNRATILNLAAPNGPEVDIGASEAIAFGGANTFPLAPGASIDLYSRGEVWAIANGATQVAIAAVREERSGSVLGEVR